MRFSARRNSSSMSSGDLEGAEDPVPPLGSFATELSEPEGVVELAPEEDPAGLGLQSMPHWGHFMSWGSATRHRGHSVSPMTEIRFFRASSTSSSDGVGDGSADSATGEPAAMESEEDPGTGEEGGVPGGEGALSAEAPASESRAP